MKKLLITLLIAFGAYSAIQAVPAYPGRFKFTQPDGTVITLQRHGDEYFNWTTDESGRILSQNRDGFYRPMPKMAFESQRSQALLARKLMWSSFEEHRETNFEDRKILCILANFTDSTFVIDNPNEAFHRLLNEEGYNENGAIGSVRDYYLDNSHEQYRPTFDVFGPVNLTHSSQYYDTNGAHLAIIEAYNLLADQINIDDYDSDNNGDIDMILFYYPGHNEAEGGGTESIWPHQSTSFFGTLGGKRFTRYFCTSELKYSTGALMCGIGTTCHEFAHSLGLPDFYDTDYKTNGSNNIPSALDIMAGGNYNGDCQKPPYFNSVELNMLGWMDYPQILPEGDITLQPVYNYQAYQCASPTEGEYFVFETRDKHKWDSAIGHSGLVIYHIDKSSRIITGNSSAEAIWNTNMINAYGGHPCFDYVSSNGKGSYTFPGFDNVTSWFLSDWDNNQNGVILQNISFDGSVSTFSVGVVSDRHVFGKVLNRYNEALAGAQVVVTRSAYPFAAAPALLDGDLVTETDENGHFDIVLPENASNYQILTVRKEGYIPLSQNIEASLIFNTQNIYMRFCGLDPFSTIKRYDSSLTFYRLGGYKSTCSAFGIHYPAKDLADIGAVGCTISAVTFSSSEDRFEKVYVIIDINGERALLKDVTSKYHPGVDNVINITDEGIVIPQDAAIIIGYGFTNSTAIAPYGYAYGPMATNNNGCWLNSDFLNGTKWKSVSYSGSYFGLTISAELSFNVEVEPDNYGVSFIKIENDVPVVKAQSGKTVYTTEWFLDGAPVEAPAALSTAPAGKHTYMVRLTFYDGTKERVYYDFTK